MIAAGRAGLTHDDAVPLEFVNNLHHPFRGSRLDLAPVHTIFPAELKITVAVLGFFDWQTKPGNFSGRYPTLRKTLTIELRSMFW